MNHVTALGGGRAARIPWVLSLLLLLAAGVSAITALAMPELIHGPAVMVGSMRGTALVVLVFAMTLLIVSMAAARSGSLFGVVGRIGAVAFIAYQGWMFVFAVPFNGLFLVYVAMLAFGFWGLVVLAVGVPVDRYASSFAPSLPACSTRLRQRTQSSRGSLSVRQLPCARWDVTRGRESRRVSPA